VDRKAIVALLTWDRVVPWKVLCLPRGRRSELVPLGFGTDTRVLHPGTTIWVVAVPKIAGLPATLVARVRIDHSYRRDHRPARCSKFLSDMLDQWKFVGTSDRGSRFFELNDARGALNSLGLSTRQLGFRKSVVVDPDEAATAFQTCTSTRSASVFLSYTHAMGRSTALPLVRELQERRLRPWLDHLALPGFELQEEPKIDERRLSRLIRLGIRQSRHAVVLKTRDWGHTRWTERERRWIAERRKEDDRFRCVQVVWTKRGLAGFKRLDPAPVAELARRISSELRR
jgi:hypothetical protein